MFEKCSTPKPELPHEYRREVGSSFLWTKEQSPDLTSLIVIFRLYCAWIKSLLSGPTLLLPHMHRLLFVIVLTSFCLTPIRNVAMGAFHWSNLAELDPDRAAQKASSQSNSHGSSRCGGSHV